MMSMCLKTVNLYWLSVLTINYSKKSGALQKVPLFLFEKVLHFETERIYLY